MDRVSLKLAVGSANSSMCSGVNSDTRRACVIANNKHHAHARAVNGFQLS